MEKDKSQFPILREKGIYKFHTVSISGNQNIKNRWKADDL